MKNYIIFIRRIKTEQFGGVKRVKCHGNIRNINEMLNLYRNFNKLVIILFSFLYLLIFVFS